MDKAHPFYIVFGDHTRNFNIATESFCIMDNVKVLIPKSLLSINKLLFIITSWKKQIPNKGYSRHWSAAQNISFKIPISIAGNIDFDFMESFTAELEAERTAKLEAYLALTGLKDYHLTAEEQRSLDEYNNIEWREFKLEKLFEKVKTIKLMLKAEDLPKQPIGIYTLPCLTSSFNNQGLNYYVPKNGTTILKEVISIPSNSDVYRAYFQSNEFTVLSDAYAIRWIYNNIKLLPNQYLFAVQCINKVTDLPKYSYKNKLGGWNVVKNKNILLPVKNDKIDYNVMNILISAMKKLAIKDVVLYTDRKIAATKELIKK